MNKNIDGESNEFPRMLTQEGTGDFCSNPSGSLAVFLIHGRAGKKLTVIEAKFGYPESRLSVD